MRFAWLALLAALALAGCTDRIACKNDHPSGTDCSYGNAGAEARATYPAWNETLAHRGAAALGAPGSALDGRLATGEAFRVSGAPNGSMVLSVTYAFSTGLGYTSEEARAMADAGAKAAEPRFAQARAVFENATGLSGADVQWLTSVAVA